MDLFPAFQSMALSFFSEEGVSSSLSPPPLIRTCFPGKLMSVHSASFSLKRDPPSPRYSQGVFPGDYIHFSLSPDYIGLFLEVPH